MRFSDIGDFRGALRGLPEPDLDAIGAATDRNDQLTKPPGALGRLEDLAIWYAGWRGDHRPTLNKPSILVFAGNHGVAARRVSAFPSEVTVQMVANFDAGGAAINQLAHASGASFSVHPLDLDEPTLDFTASPAMDVPGFCAAANVGWQAVDPGCDLLIVGEMGIANTTSAAALSVALFGGTGSDWAGRGTGVDDEGLRLKAAVIDEALALHGGALADPLEALRRVGGRELVAMASAILRARHLRIPVILDGFICTAAAAVLEKARPGALDHTIAGHLSGEGAHDALLSNLGKEPLLSLGLRLGEGSGAAVALNILKSAIACHSGMATFAEAAVSGG